MPQRPQPVTERAVTRERLRLLLVERGYLEAITYSFVDPRLQRLCSRAQRAHAREPDLRGTRRDACFAVARPRRGASSQPAAAAAARADVRGRPRFEVEAGVLAESQAIAGLIAGPALPEQWGAEKRDVDFFDVKADVEALFA